ncbi:MAG: hypothetical protein IJ137_02885 [Eubacterium sp.]|nr:hypothetical protein [Eubacterium sp.]
MKIILEEEHEILTEYGGYRLRYELIESPSGEVKGIKAPSGKEGGIISTSGEVEGFKSPPEEIRVIKPPSGEEGGSAAWYGLRITQIRELKDELFDVCQISRITQDYHEAKALFQMVAEGLVMPVSLMDVIHDWLVSSAC